MYEVRLATPEQRHASNKNRARFPAAVELNRQKPSLKSEAMRGMGNYLVSTQCTMMQTVTDY